MSKIEISEAVAVASLKLNLTEQKLNAFETELRERAEANKKPKDATIKKQFVIVLNDPKGKLKGSDFTGWVVQIPEDNNPATALEKLHLGAYDFNRSAKGRRYPVKTVAEACEFGSAKIFKEQKIWVKTKEPVLVVRTDGKLPRE